VPELHDDVGTDRGPDLDLGREIVWRLLSPKSWIHRRVESVRFLDENTLRREVSVDCDVDWPTGGVALLPLARIGKRPLVSFDLRDEAGNALPVLTTNENGHVAWSALVAAAQAVLGAEVPSSIRISLRSVVFLDPALRGATLKAVRELEIDKSARQELFERPGFSGLFESLARGFLLVTPVAHPEAGRRIFKYAYSESFFRDRRAPLMQSLGLDPLLIDFDVPLIGEAQSYHLECEVPEDLQIADATLIATTADGTRDSAAVGRGERVHLLLSDLDPVAEGIATVRVTPSATGTLRATTLSTFIISLTLVLGAVFGHRIAQGSDAAAAVLLLVPGLMIALVLRPGEHRLASLVLRGLRAMVLVAAWCSFVAAGLIALSVSGSALTATFTCLATVAAGCAAVALVALVRAQGHSESSQRLRKLDVSRRR
jgi:hypothetical protein